MTYWQEVKQKVIENVSSNDLSETVYRKLATTKTNSFKIVKPSFYIGQLSVETMDFIDIVEKLLRVYEKDWTGLLKGILYLREISKAIHKNIVEASDPLDDMLLEMEDLYGVDEFDDDDEETEEPEMAEEASIQTEVDVDSSDNTCDILAQDRQKLEEDLRVLFRTTGCTDIIVDKLAEAISKVYLECIQFTRELTRLSDAPDGDLATILSILIDIQFCLDIQLRYLLYPDIFVEDDLKFKLGLQTWTAHFLSEITEKINSSELELVASK